MDEYLDGVVSREIRAQGLSPQLLTDWQQGVIYFSALPLLINAFRAELRFLGLIVGGPDPQKVAAVRETLQNLLSL